jgi:hypothetical protein
MVRTVRRYVVLVRSLFPRWFAVSLLAAIPFFLLGCPPPETVDDDGDGFSEEDGDCDDEDILIYPGAPEACDGVDNDCDTLVDEDFDGDLDGFFDEADCSGGTDCDDTDDEVHPDADEACDDVDHDCDGETHNGLVAYTYCEDNDGDGSGGALGPDTCDETPPIGYVECPDTPDCDDSNGTIFPGATEVCDGVDNDCNDLIDDELDDYEYWEDGDGDGFGAGDIETTCDSTPGPDQVEYDELELDCDDTDDEINPDASEVCNGVDDNCDDTIDEGFDADGDLVATCGPDGIEGNADDDCDDAVATTYPAAPELCDGVDNNCEGTIDEALDLDADGYTSCGADGLPDTPDDDCDDTNPNTYPLAPEVCDGEDNDCNDEVPTNEADGDLDGYPGCAECDDGNAAINPGAAEECDGLDTDCDGAAGVDEVDVDTDQYLACSGYVANGAIGILGGDDCDDGDITINPAALELCDLVDNDCDLGIDEDFDTDLDGVTTCGPDGIAATADDDCDDTDGTVYPGALEFCDQQDNSCNGDVDDDDTLYAGDDYDGDGDIGYGCGGLDCNDNDPTVQGLDVDNDGSSTCDNDCDDMNPHVEPSANESCDGIDNDCDGNVDTADSGLMADADGDGFDSVDCGFGGTDCNDNDKHIFADDVYTSGVVPVCEPAVTPGWWHEWDYARISLPHYFENSDGTHYLYYRGNHDQPSQQVGVSFSDDGVEWTKHPDPVLGPTTDWDFRNISDPAVVELPATFARPYVMLYHARAESGGLRQIGLATATDPLGPFERLDALTGAAVADPVIPPSTTASYLDSGRTLHPTIYWDGTELHAWYNARTDSDSTLRVFHATSGDGGATWARTDGDGDGPDVIFEPSMSPVATGRTDQLSVTPDPFTTGEFEVFYAADLTVVGYTTGTATFWETGYGDAALEPAADCNRMDGLAVVAPSIRYDGGDDIYHWYYDAQTDIKPVADGGTCVANEDAVYLWFNGTYVVSYISQGTNHAPEVIANVPAAPGSSMVFDGDVTDTAPDMVVVTVDSDIDGDLGAAVVTATGNTLQTVQTTAWTLSVTGVSSGTHDITVTATDEAGIARSTSISVTVP